MSAEIIETAKDRLVKSYNQGAPPFGSCMGRPSDRSDLDVLVVIDHLVERVDKRVLKVIGALAGLKIGVQL